jgi:hypothetical protein
LFWIDAFWPIHGSQLEKGFLIVSLQITFNHLRNRKI